MAAFRYFNLKSTRNVGHGGLKVKYNVKRVFDFLTLTDYGNVADSADDFPNKGAGIFHTTFVGSALDMGGIADTNVIDTIDYGSIA